MKLTLRYTREGIEVLRVLPDSEEVNISLEGLKLNKFERRNLEEEKTRIEKEYKAEGTGRTRGEKMIGQNTLKVYGYNSIIEYFGYIVESRTNGQHKQAKELYLKLSKEQKEEFYNFLKMNEIKFDLSGYF
jgi:hypothetical protein